ncbi:MAG: hypothetical protein PHU85_13370 [Phycisphaerae bacterium]|nr:hypothetical protein [Phycisphaerae bacterium]
MLEEQGKVPKGTLHKWAKETPNMKSLPERKGNGKGKKATKRKKR